MKKANATILERSVQVLKKSEKWEFSAPEIPLSYWTDRDFGQDYTEDMDHFIGV